MYHTATERGLRLYVMYKYKYNYSHISPCQLATLTWLINSYEYSLFDPLNP